MSFKELKDKLTMNRRHSWERMTEEDKAASEVYAREYMSFLDLAKTEREAVSLVSALAVEQGFIPLDQATKQTARIFWTHRGKMAALIRMGKKDLSHGFHLVAAHLDSPRLDLKLNPLYEAQSMAWLKTHYYGGIKKYQWVTIPLALHGVVIRADGSVLELSIGEDPSDPVLTIPDLLPHLSHKIQEGKNLGNAIPGEKLNVLVGGIPLLEEDASDFRLAILSLLSERYGLVEEDLITAELELVPAGRARDVGLDRAFVGGYGQDDRSCAFAGLKALLARETGELTSIVLLMDKEETGSDGDTGAKSRIFELLISDLMRLQGLAVEGDSLLRVFSRSRALSADVTAGIDPNWEQVHDRHNDARIGYGINLTKYTGSRGKSGANDAHAELLGWLRGVWNRAGVVWQAGEMGRVDEGGGGTIAKFLAAQGMEVVDAGPPLLSMHAPFEVAHKADLYMCFKAYKAFLEA